MPIAVNYLSSDGTRVQVDAEEGVNLMQTAVTNGVTGIVGECGGSAMCATCHVYVDDAFLKLLPEMNQVENEMLECTASERRGGSRLSCQIIAKVDIDGIIVMLPETQT